MATFATILAIAAAFGAAVSWIAGAVYFVRTLQALSGESGPRQILFAAVAWPFASRRATGEAAVHAAKVNKALVAFITCVMIAAAATSIATNLSRYSR